MTYRRDISLIPRAVVVAAKGAFRHPWTWSGPLFGWVILVVLVLVFVPFGVSEVLAGDERTLALVMTPIALYVGLGSGIGLVRDTCRLVGSDHAGAE